MRELNKKQNVTLSNLYETISKDPRVETNSAILKHRIRARLYSLENSGKVTKVSRATFMKI